MIRQAEAIETRVDSVGMIETAKNRRCSGAAGTARSKIDLSLPVVESIDPRGIRKSRTSVWRAASLIVLHLVIIGHVIHWLVTGRTLSPVEPSETMYTLNEGLLNAGFIFFVTAILATLVFGRFVCGWGCHVVAYQDLCAWMLKKLGIKPKPFRSRLLVLAPLALALYMFVWPSVYRWFADIPAPTLSNHMMTTEFWKTFPGPVVAALTIAVCGFAIVYFLGAKGFCTYGCPYGGFFALADQVSAGRILVTADCEHCGHCTATCTSNVRVHEEVALYGMVVDPGCMKCMDCVSVCPNDALYFGFAKPPIFARRGSNPFVTVESSSSTRSHDARRAFHDKPGRYDFSPGEEVIMAVIGVAALLSFRGLYGQIPLLMAMGLAAITGFAALKLTHIARLTNVRWQNLQLKIGNRVTRVGRIFAGSTVAWLAFMAHSGVVRYNTWRGHDHFIAAAVRGDERFMAVVDDSVWEPGDRWRGAASEVQRNSVVSAVTYLERADRWGLMNNPSVLQDLVWLYLAQNRTDDAERTLRRIADLSPEQPEVYRGLASLYRKTSRFDLAERQYREALQRDAAYKAARADLGQLLVQMRRFDEAIALYREALSLDPNFTDARFFLAAALLERGEFSEAAGHLQRVIQERPTMAEAHYNLAVATFMSGRPADAVPIAREAIRLNPGDAQSHEFLSMLLNTLGDGAGAIQAAERARRIRAEKTPTD